MDNDVTLLIGIGAYSLMLSFDWWIGPVWRWVAEKVELFRLIMNEMRFEGPLGWRIIFGVVLYVGLVIPGARVVSEEILTEVANIIKESVEERAS